MRRHRRTEGFNLAFLDIMSCGLGAVILVFMLVKFNVSDSNIEENRLEREVQRLEVKEDELQQTLEQLRDTSLSETEKIAKLNSKLIRLEQSLSKKELSLVNKKDQLAALKNDISNRPIAHKEDLVEDDRGGEEDYLMGLKVEGRRIVVLIDSSASMTDETLLNIIKRKNGSVSDKKRGPKWLRTKKTVRWILARAPKTSQLSVIYFNDSVKTHGKSSWVNANSSATLKALYQQLDTIVPSGATNLQIGLQAVAKRGATDLYVITDGLPTVGESRYASLNLFSGCSSLLGKSSTISGECRVRLFRQTIQDSNLRGVKVNVILFPLEGDPDAVNEYWGWAGSTDGLVFSPAANWP